jgi:arylsulfatase A-like enzyme
MPFAFRFGLVSWLGQTRHLGDIPGAWHARQYEQIHREARVVIADRNFDLVFLHYPIPHYPFISLGQTEEGSTSDYAGNVALADRTLGELRQALLESGLSNQTAMVVTSDHWHRKTADFARVVRPQFGDPRHRVPLILHFPGQTAPQAISPPIQSVATYYLVLSLLSGEVRGAEDLPKAIDSWPGWVRRTQGLTQSP